MTQKNLSKDLDVVGIGNAIIDALAHVGEDFLANSLPAGVQPYAMTLITEPQADEIYDSLKNCTIMPGGSAANSIASFAALGGRANWDGTLGDQGAQVSAGGVNNFQGRYIIRHYWTGAVACKEPRYGDWGGPPSGGGGEGTKAAQDLANAPRGKVLLREVVESAVPAFGITGKKRALRPGEKAR